MVKMQWIPLFYDRWCGRLWLLERSQGCDSLLSEGWTGEHQPQAGLDTTMYRHSPDLLTAHPLPRLRQDGRDILVMDLAKMDIGWRIQGLAGSVGEWRPQ